MYMDSNTKGLWLNYAQYFLQICAYSVDTANLPLYIPFLYIHAIIFIKLI